MTFHSASRSRFAVLSAAPATSEMLYTRTSALAGSASAVGDALVVEVAVTVVTAVDELLSLSSPEPMAWNPTSRNTTPRNSSTMTMARRGNPEDSR